MNGAINRKFFFLFGILSGSLIGILVLNLSIANETGWNQALQIEPYESLEDVKLEIAGQPDFNDDGLLDDVRVLCSINIVGTSNKSAQFIKNTWGKRCNVMLFSAGFKDNTLPMIDLAPGKKNLSDSSWEKVKLNFEYVHKNFRDRADWFLKADEGTYVVLGNLRYLLKSYNKSLPLYVGHQVQGPQPFMKGSPGFVLSRAALDKLVEKGPEVCHQNGSAEADVEMGKCMKALGVNFIDTKDKNGRYRFVPYSPETHEPPPQQTSKIDLPHLALNETDKGVSESFVSFSNVDRSVMEVLDFILYSTKVSGVAPWFEN